MGFIVGIIKLLVKLAVYFVIFAALIVLIPNLPPYTKFSSIKIEPTQARVGPLAQNGDLNNVEKLYKGKVLGPEAFEIHNGELYTGLATGEIVKISPGGHVTFVTQIGQPCRGLNQEHVCGRPLGFEIDSNNNLMYVADPYLGIWKVNLKTNKKQILVSPRVEIQGFKPKIINDLALAKNGDLYWSDSNTDFALYDGVYTTLVDPSGRLLHYNAATNESKVLLNNLYFSNGVALSPDNQFVLVAETCGYRIIKYYINGPKKGKSEPFVTGLPGMPDNLRPLPDGSGVLISLYTVFNDEHPLILKSMSETPHVRKFLARLLRIIEIPFEFLNSHYPHPILEDIVYNIGHFKSMKMLTPPMSGLVHMDWNGNIVASYYNTDQTVDHISDVIVYNGKLYLGNPQAYQDFIGAVAAPPLLQKAFAQAKSPEAKPNIKVETVQQTKPKIQEKAKVDEKKEVPKTMKPVAQEQPKAPPQKHSEPVKTTTPKPVQVKTTPPTPTTQPPKPVTQPPKPVTQPPKPTTETPKPTTQQPPVKKESTVNPEVKTTPTPTTAKPQKVAQEQPAKPNNIDSKTKKEESKQQKSAPPKSEQKSDPPKQIPIKEEIPSDTIKPSKETLKVIKKGGPTEIPNPNL